MLLDDIITIVIKGYSNCYIVVPSYLIFTSLALKKNARFPPGRVRPHRACGLHRNGGATKRLALEWT